MRALQEVLGKEGLQQVVARAGLPATFVTGIATNGRDWPETTHNLAGSVTRAVFDLYGDLAKEHLYAAGRWQFKYARENLPMHINALAGMLKALPVDVRMKMVLEQGARDLRRSSNALPEITADASSFVIVDPASPTCAGQTAKFPMCFSRVGLMTASMEWATGDATVEVVETACRAMGGRDCRFRIPKKF